MSPNYLKLNSKINMDRIHQGIQYFPLIMIANIFLDHEINACCYCFLHFIKKVSKRNCRVTWIFFSEKEGQNIQKNCTTNVNKLFICFVLSKCTKKPWVINSNSLNYHPSVAVWKKNIHVHVYTRGT